MKLPKDYIVNIKGKDFITYNGLLGIAHEKGLREFKVVDIQVDWGNKQAYCIVKAIFEDREFFGIGSSTPQNTGNMVKEYFVEMAHTRAKARALRDACNIHLTAVDELTDTDSVIVDDKEVENKFRCSGCDNIITKKVSEYSLRQYNKPLCMECQKNHNSI